MPWMLSDRVRSLIDRKGEATLINGLPTLAVWKRAQPGRIQMFLNELQQGVPAYEVQFAKEALGPPLSLGDGDEITRVSDGWVGAVRSLDAPALNTDTALVRVIVVLLSE